MQTYIGTSGFSYSWNPDGLEWYLQNSNLNAQELNSSFYRFPFPSQVKGWSRKTKELNPKLRWSIKVNRLITHVFKLSERAFATWKKFEQLFEPLSPFIDFYLFQLPPAITPSSAERIAKFYEQTKLKEKFALEWRNLKWFEENWIKWAEELGLTLVSVDAPYHTGFPYEIYCTNGLVYLRLHGRIDWYAYDYSREELEEIAKKIIAIKPKKAYVFANNDHAMLSNAQELKKIFEALLKQS